MIRLVAFTVGVSLSSTYAYVAWFTTFLKGSGLDIFFVSSGMILAPVGAGIVWVLESTGLVSDSGMVGGFVMFALGAYILWSALFSVAAFFLIRKLKQ